MKNLESFSNYGQIITERTQLEDFNRKHGGIVGFEVGSVTDFSYNNIRSVILAIPEGGLVPIEEIDSRSFRLDQNKTNLKFRRVPFGVSEDHTKHVSKYFGGRLAGMFDGFNYRVIGFFTNPGSREEIARDGHKSLLAAGNVIPHEIVSNVPYRGNWKNPNKDEILKCIESL